MGTVAEAEKIIENAYKGKVLGFIFL